MLARGPGARVRERERDAGRRPLDTLPTAVIDHSSVARCRKYNVFVVEYPLKSQGETF